MIPTPPLIEIQFVCSPDRTEATLPLPSRQGTGEPPSASYENFTCRRQPLHVSFALDRRRAAYNLSEIAHKYAAVLCIFSAQFEFSLSTCFRFEQPS